MKSDFSNVEVVGFDLDQTLYPKSPDIDEAIQRYLYECIAEMHNISLEAAKGLFTGLYQGGQGLSGSATMRQLGFENGGQLVQQALETADLTEYLKPNSDDIEFLTRLSETYSLDVITGSNRSNTTTKLSKLAISHSLFQTIITADDYSKSNGDAYIAWLKGYPDFEPDNFLYVGDRFKTDHVVPSGLGIQTVIVNVDGINPEYDCLQLPTFANLDDYLG